MKKFWKFLIFILLILSVHAYVHAFENNTLNEIYTEQFKISEAEKLTDNLPKDYLKSLDRIGVSGANWEEISKLSPSKIFREIFSTLRQKLSSPLKSLIPTAAIILLCALVSSIKTSFGNNHISEIMSAVSTLCLCAVIVTPIIACINSSMLVIKSASGFTLCAAPIMAAIMIASGNPIAGVSYQTLIIAAGQVISHLAGNFLAPFMNMLLGISLISSLSSRLNLESLCGAIYKSIKFVLKFAASIFTGMLTLQNIVTTSADNIGTSTLKFAIDGCVPIVGGALSDALTTVQGCVKLLKSGVGAFGIIAGGIIFLPIIIECSVWIVFLNLCASMGNVFELKKISALLKSASNVMSITLAALLCVMTVLIVSTVLILIIGR